MKIAPAFLALGILMASWIVPVQAEEITTVGNHCSPTFEIESQIPCFFYGGYQFSIGMRKGHFRFRASILDSGSADFESFGLDRKNDNFERSYDSGSFALSADYFLSDYWFSYVTLGSHRWLLRSNLTSSTDHLRTLDAGLGTGLQYFFYRDVFVQLSCHVNFRERQSLLIQGEEYVIASVEWSPGLRIGVRF